VVKDADLMFSPEEDHFGPPDSTPGQIVIHDVTRKPWPFKDCEYDLVVALNVFEHLDNKQSRAFREVMRITRHAILTVP
jgi:SAM-dependent methyltransferase